jgi:hypothetical protein
VTKTILDHIESNDTVKANYILMEHTNTGVEDNQFIFKVLGDYYTALRIKENKQNEIEVANIHSHLNST